MSWIVPVALGAAVVGGLALLRSTTLMPKAGDLLAVQGQSLQAGLAQALPFPLPPNATEVLFRVTAADKMTFQGQIVGYVDPQTGQPMTPLGASQGFPYPSAIERRLVVGQYRNGQKIS